MLLTCTSTAQSKAAASAAVLNAKCQKHPEHTNTEKDLHSRSWFHYILSVKVIWGNNIILRLLPLGVWQAHESFSTRILWRIVHNSNLLYCYPPSRASFNLTV